VEAFPETAARIPEAGHLVGNHSFYHARMPLLSRSGLEIDIRSAEAVIRDYVGVDPRPWFRLPFGEGWDDAKLQHRIELFGYRHVGWHIDVQEWRPEATAPEVEDAMVAGTLAAGDGAVILLHTWPRLTLSVENVIRRLADRGATFVRLDDLPNAPAGLPLEAEETPPPGLALAQPREPSAPSDVETHIPIAPARP
jgi:peptidoglycan/xylan/chitin deacetylase (PgdA/CDA1 family)